MQSSFLSRHRPALFVLASQVTAAAMNAAAKFIETGQRSTAVHPFMILHVRMLITGLGCTLLLWHMENGDSESGSGGSPKSDALLGPRRVRSLILLRAVGGVFGASGFFCMLVFVSFLFPYLILCHPIGLPNLTLGFNLHVEPPLHYSLSPSLVCENSYLSHH